jgi:hypothetical protein
MKEFIKQWWLEIIIIFLAFILFVSGFIFELFPSVQVVIKKTFLVAWWYFLAYVFRRFRLGRIEWSEDEKKVYYFVILFCSCLIFALG